MKGGSTSSLQNGHNNGSFLHPANYNDDFLDDRKGLSSLLIKSVNRVKCLLNEWM